MLREHKRRVVGYIESTISENALDMGTSVMVMQTKCKTPGCVPLETSIVIVFPRDGNQYIDGVEESCGGSFKTTILLPLSEVTRDDVLDSLPPGFKGGRKTWENTCFALRDFVLGRIGGTVGSGNTDAEKDNRRILSQYLIACLDDYIENGCQAPELGMPFPIKDKQAKESSGSGSSSSSKVKGDNESETKSPVSEGTNNSTEPSDESKKSVLELQSSNTKQMETAMDWRRRQTMLQTLQLPDSNNMVQRLAEREHLCTRTSSCPCCETDSIQDLSNAMMSL